MTALALAYTVDPEVAEDSPSGASLRGPHRLAAVETCERMWALRYYWYFRPKKDNPWRLGGSLIHTCLQYYYGRLMVQQGKWPGDWYKKPLMQRLAEQAAESDTPIKERDELVTMALNNLYFYSQTYENDAKLLYPMGIEEEYSATIGELDPGGPWPELDNDVVTVRSDLVYTTETGNIWIMDYKSHGRSRVNRKTGRLTLWKEEGEYAINFQVLMNLLVLRARFGSRVRGFVIQRVTRQEPYDFDRHVLTIPEGPYREAPRMMRELVKHEYDIIAKINAGGRPSPRFNACYGRYGACDYRWVCLAGDRTTMNNRLMEDYTQMPIEEVTSMRARLRVVQ